MGTKENSEVVPGKPSTWVKFRKPMCASCWSTCCHDLKVEASIPDMIRLFYLTEEEATTSLGAAARRLRAHGIISAFKRSEFVFVLQQKKNKDCLFLDRDRRCTVYERRPEICRQFPKIGPRPGHCPYVAK